MVPGFAGSLANPPAGLDQESRPSDSERESSQGSSWTVKRSAGHRSAAQSEELDIVLELDCRCSTPVTIQGLSGPCSG